MDERENYAACGKNVPKAMQHRRVGVYMDYELDDRKKICKAVADMLDETERRVAVEVKTKSIKSVIESFGCTPQEAMEWLKIPEEERKEYLERLHGGSEI